MSFIKTLIKRIVYPETYSERAYISSLRKKHCVDIGEHCRIWEPINTYIDTQRPHMLHIGDYVKITRNVTILCHDYSRSVSCNIPGKENIGEAKYTYIGDNVFIGMNAVILMGARIGDNCIVGAGAVVGGNFPDNVVIAGNPGKIICSLEEFDERRKFREMESAKDYVAHWRTQYGSDPSIEDMTDAFAWLYLAHTKETMEKYPKLFRFGGVNHDNVVNNFLSTKPVFENYEEFLRSCK